jgi:hypothetical protein
VFRFYPVVANEVDPNLFFLSDYRHSCFGVLAGLIV